MGLALVFMESLKLNQNSSNEIDFVSLKITCLTSTSAKGGETYTSLLLSAIVPIGMKYEL